MASLKIGPDEYNLDFVTYGEPVEGGFALHFADGGSVMHTMDAAKAAQVHALLPEDKRNKPAEAKPGKTKAAE